MRENRRHVGSALHQLHNLMQRDNNRFPHTEMVDKLTGNHGFVLCWLCDRQADGEVFQRDMERQLRLRRSSATGVLQVMEQSGLIVREGVPQDARLKKLVVTDRGWQVYHIIRSDIAETERRLVADIDAEALRTFWQVLDKIRDNLERGLYTEQERRVPAQQEGKQ